MIPELGRTYCGKPEPTVECEALGYCDYHAGITPGNEAESCSEEAVENWRWYVDARSERVASHPAITDRPAEPDSGRIR